MTIRFSKKTTDEGIILNNNTRIQNWDTKSPDKTKNKLVFDFYANQNERANIGNVQEQLFKALACGNDNGTYLESQKRYDDIDVLTEYDLLHAKKRFNTDTDVFKNLKDKNGKAIVVKEFRYDEHYGIANITTQNGEVLRVDLLTEKERQNGEDSSKGIFKLNNTKQPVSAEPKAKSNNTAAQVQNKQSKSKQVQSKQVQSGKKKDVDAFLIALGNRESSGNHKIMNKYGYVGLYQVGEEALKDVGVYYETKDINYKKNDWKGYVRGGNKYGITCLWDFMHSPKKQKAVQIDFKKKHWQYLKNLKLTEFVGKTINGIRITESGLLAGAHLVGPGGVRDYLRSNGKKDVQDANGTKVSSYIKKFAGYNIKDITQN